MTLLSAETERPLEAAANLLQSADALVISAGAGMGVDSGLPDFRGREGFWNAYPAARALGLDFYDLANPEWFHRDPCRAWGFYGHRFNLYRATEPHAGFQILQSWRARLGGGLFVVTSNVDGHFQSAGFDEDEIYECHGAIQHWQCSEPCGDHIWPAGELEVDVDEVALRARPELPRCPRCGAVARPNILMFGDGHWLASRSDAQQRRFAQWLRQVRDGRLVCLEFGAGTAVPTIRRIGESLGCPLIRVNPAEPEVGAGGIGVPLGALDCLQQLDRRLQDAR